MQLREYIIKKNMTATDFSQRINYNRSYITEIMLGRKIPGKKLAKIIEQATNGIVTVEELMNPKPWPEYENEMLREKEKESGN